MKSLLRNVLDPAVEHVQHMKLSGSEFTMITFILPQVLGIPKMHRHGRIKKYTTKRTMKFTEKNYKMKTEEYVRVQEEGGIQGEAEYYEYYGEDDDGYFVRIQEKGEEEEYDLLPPGSSFIKDSAEMNAIRPEDLDEQGKGSKVSLVVFITNFILY